MARILTSAIAVIVAGYIAGRIIHAKIQRG
jgi:hypothetical protein